MKPTSLMLMMAVMLLVTLAISNIIEVLVKNGVSRKYLDKTVIKQLLMLSILKYMAYN